MKVLSLKLNDKTYLTGKITAYFSGQALSIQKDSLLIVKLANELQSCENQEESIKKAEQLYNQVEELRQRKIWLITEIYQKQFTSDELLKSLDDQEIDEAIKAIISGITGVITKN